MASSLVLEMTISKVMDCVIAPMGTPTVKLYNPNIHAELLNFDSTYDTGFYYGMQQFGIPLKFSSWHSHTDNLSGNSNTFQIHERARSIKQGLAAIRDTEKSVRYDTNRLYQAGAAVLVASDSGVGEYDLQAGPALAGLTRTNCGAVSEYQWRIGGRYYPSQPVDCTLGAAEAYVELQKTMDAVGDYTFGNNIDPADWSVDYQVIGANKFLMCGQFESSDPNPDTISGINGEEQSDIMLTIKLEPGTGASFYRKQLHVFIAYDALLIVRPENSVELVM